jgi:hypothetical protein
MEPAAEAQQPDLASALDWSALGAGVVWANARPARRTIVWAARRLIVRWATNGDFAHPGKQKRLTWGTLRDGYWGMEPALSVVEWVGHPSTSSTSSLKYP